MSEPRLHAATQAAEAKWLAPRLHPFGSGVVASVVPDGFPAYVRILHPAVGPDDQPLRWAEVAEMSGRIMHRLVQLHALNPGSLRPPPGNLAPNLLKALCTILKEHTGTAHSCWFCVWAGHGCLNDKRLAWTFYEISSDVPQKHAARKPSPPSPPGLLQAARVHLPHRDYLLLNGPIDAVSEPGWMLGDRWMQQSPNLFWPQDRSWCVASEIDLFCTLVAGSEALAEAILADLTFESWRVFPTDPITADSDTVNVDQER